MLWIVDWGDGTSELASDATELQHTYRTPGTKSIQVSAAYDDGPLDVEPLEVVVLNKPGKEFLCNGSFEQTTVNARWDLFSEMPCWQLVDADGAHVDVGSSAFVGPYIEIQKGILGGAAHGSNHLELDADQNGPGGGRMDGERGQIAIAHDDVNTIKDVNYVLRFAHKGRPGQESVPEDNTLRVSLFSVDVDENDTETLTRSNTATFTPSSTIRAITSGGITRGRLRHRPTKYVLSSRMQERLTIRWVRF